MSRQKRGNNNNRLFKLIIKLSLRRPSRNKAIFLYLIFYLKCRESIGQIKEIKEIKNKELFKIKLIMFQVQLENREIPNR